MACPAEIGDWVLGAGALFIAVFLACAVEAVEATTIVLAAGTARDWRSAEAGGVVALVALAPHPPTPRPAVRAPPIAALRGFLGAPLLAVRLQMPRHARLPGARPT